MMLEQMELKRHGSTFDALSSINSNKSKMKVFPIKTNKLFYYRVTLGLKTAISFHFLCPWWLSLHWQAWGCNGSCVFYAGNICWYVAFVSRPIPFGIPSSQFPVPSSTIRFLSPQALCYRPDKSSMSCCIAPGEKWECGWGNGDFFASQLVRLCAFCAFVKWLYHSNDSKSRSGYQSLTYRADGG